MKRVPKKRVFRRVLLSALLLCLISALLLPSPSHGLNPDPQILILSSYHQGYTWSDNQIHGILSGLRRTYPHVEPSFEYMDSKRFPHEYQIAVLKDYLASKYADRRFDVILVLDNPAFELLLRHGAEVFPGAPVVFTGVSNFLPEMIQGRKVTGVAEVQPVAETLDLVIAIHPGVKEVLFISDNTLSGLASMEEIKRILPRFENRVKFKTSPNIPFRELLASLSSVPQDSLALVSAYARDSEGLSLGLEESTRLISANCPVPLYAMHETRLGNGIVGGMLIDGKEHGEEAAAVALRILTGQDPEEIPVRKSRSRPMFDSFQLARFKIPESSIPPHSVVVNRPVSFWELHKPLLVPVSAVLGFLIFLLFVLSAFLVRVRLAESRMRRSEERYRNLFDQAPVGYMEYDPQGRITRVNQRELDMLGYTAAEMAGRPVWEFVMEKESEEMVRAKLAGIHPGNRSLERTYRTKNGTTLPVLIEDLILRDKSGHILGVRSTIQDITVKKQAEEELRKTTATNQMLLDALPCVAFLLKPGSREIVASNEAGRRAGALPGKTCYATWGHREDPCPWCLAPEAWKSEEPQQLEVDAIGVIWDAHWVPLSKDVYLHYAFDITDKRRALEGLQQAQKMEAIGTLAGGIAHDFNNSLGAILGYTEMAMGEVSPHVGKAYYYLQNVYKAGERARDLVKQILTFSRQSKQELRPLKLSSVLKETLKLLRPAIPSTISIRHSIITDEDTILADPTQIHQVIMNLCTNAAHAMKEGGGAMSIGLSSLQMDKNSDGGVPRPGRYVLLSVQDTGHGIPPEILPRIFDPFFTTKKIGEGTGMGLAVAHGIVEGHGGAIRVESQAGVGTVFRVYLPAVEIESDSLPRVTARKAVKGKGRILIVDDEPALAEVGSMMLSMLGYEVHAETKSLSALRLFRSEPRRFDLAVLDMTMPDMTGLTLAAELLKMRPGFPVVLMTGYSELVDSEKMQSAGICCLLNKPVSSGQLADAVKEALTGAPHENSEVEKMRT